MNSLRVVNKRLTGMVLLVVAAFLIPFASFAAGSETAVLNFTDLINGPDVGLGDGKGSGVIVTIWGQNMASEDGDSKIYFKDSKDVVREVAYTYYWKKADGQLPGGPANLYESHYMYEVAVSIPDSAVGLGGLYAVINGRQTNSLPFTVRTGNIYHVKTTGSNSNSGSYDESWATVSSSTNGAASKIKGGDIVYVHHHSVDSNFASGGNKKGIYISSVEGTLDNQIGIIAYPGARVLAEGENHGVDVYHTYGMVISKYIVKAGNYERPVEGTEAASKVLPTGYAAGIDATMDGRIVGNEITDIEGRCTSGNTGAITGGAPRWDGVGNSKVLGNYIHDFGCDQSSDFQHVTYFTNRSAGVNKVRGWEMGWNYLKDNKSKHGLHNYDEEESGEDCGDVYGTILLHDNVIINQKGYGISVSANDFDVYDETSKTYSSCWSADVKIYNNIIMNVGFGPGWSHDIASNGINIVDRGLTGTIEISNNTIWGWSDPENIDNVKFGKKSGHKAGIAIGGGGDSVNLVIKGNVFYSELDVPFFKVEPQLADNVSGGRNVWYFRGAFTPSKAIQPNWDSSAATFDPQLTIVGSNVSVSNHSSSVVLAEEAVAEYVASGFVSERDIYGNTRGLSPELGAVEFMLRPGRVLEFTVE